MGLKQLKDILYELLHPSWEYMRHRINNDYHYELRHILNQIIKKME